MTLDPADPADPVLLERVTPGQPQPGPTARGAASRRLVLLIGAALAVILVVLTASSIVGGPGRHVESGIVVSVQATGLTAVQGFSIRTSDGREVQFRIEALENATTFPPGHLAEHSVTLSPITVTYLDRDGVHLALRIEDAR